MVGTWEIQPPKPDVCSSRDVTYAGRRTQVMIGTGRFSCSWAVLMLNVSHIFHIFNEYVVLRRGNGTTEYSEKSRLRGKNPAYCHQRGVP